MNLLDNIVDVKITKSTMGIRSAGFNTLLIIGNSKNESTVKAYTSLKEVAEDFDDSTNEYKAAGLAFGQSVKLNKILIGQVAKKESFQSAYKTIAKENGDFYGVMITSKKLEDQMEIAKLIESDNKIFGISSSDKKILDKQNTENVLHKLKELNMQRSFVVYNSSAEEGGYPEAAWFGLMLTKPAGSATWGFKELSGIKADSLSSTEVDALELKNGSYFCSLSGRDVMLNGRMSNGEYIDIIVGLDWLVDDLRTRVGNALIHSEKIPFNNSGISIIESMIRDSLHKAANKDIIDKESVVISVPDIQEISASDRRARILPDVKFEAVLAGAIHKIKIAGTITV